MVGMKDSCPPSSDDAMLTLVVAKWSAEKVLRYLKRRYQNEEGILDNVQTRRMIVEGHNLNLYDSEEKAKRFEEQETRFEKTVNKSILHVVQHRPVKTTCNDAHRLTLGQYAADEVERKLSGAWESVENVIEKLRELIYKSNLRFLLIFWFLK
ncbi:unnamed protein product [Caenorhabditis nigoni]